MASPYFAVRSVECSDHHVRWSTPETSGDAEVVLVHRGRFRVRSGGRASTVDPTTGYLHPAGRETSFAHPAGGDVCTSISLPGDALDVGIDSRRALPVHVDGRLELAHRKLLHSTADPDFEAAEAVVTLLQLAIRQAPNEAPTPGSYDLADRAREAMLADDPSVTSLVALADLLQSSPAHLSRTFCHHIGQSVSRYRNRVRISRALQRIDEGETDLAGLAVSLGFSDQAHFSRVMRRETGVSPGRVRQVLRGARAVSC
ncbi:AraC-type DNA-binding protein [Microlunatus soli]|uniref:AraC-type DNA-binding protein n=1 Tax=Microlunatus soli TaxID=630515 RepID=A0A1H1QI35_9ACTN|nr:AraC-type DNA-binding protein [Microlunatus soli]